MTEQKMIGNQGEIIARHYLEQKGYRYLDSQVYTPYGELDLVFMDQEVLVFVEVKTRRESSLLPLLETVNKNKINRILKSAEKYIDDNEIRFSEMRVDVILISYQGDTFKTTHLKNYC